MREDELLCMRLHGGDACRYIFLTLFYLNVEATLRDGFEIFHYSQSMGTRV
jgi:hypothetical protein